MAGVDRGRPSTAPSPVPWSRIDPEVWSKYGKTIKAMSGKGKVELRREGDGSRSWRLAPYARPEPPAEEGAGP